MISFMPNPQKADATRIRVLAHDEVERMAPVLADLLRESVNRGASLGFIPPLGRSKGLEYWLNLCPELRAGQRLLLVAHVRSRLIGAGQLAFPAWPNGQHRAEIQKLLVATPYRGRGVGTALMTALHQAAHQHGRTLILLGTRSGEPPERFYKGLGYQTAGVIPGYSTGPAGDRYDNTLLYRRSAD